jgi:hypothetical protein
MQDDVMRLVIIPLLASVILHVIGFIMTGFASTSLFLLFPAGLYSLFSIGLWRGVNWVLWVTLICMAGGIIGTVNEFSGPLMAPNSVLISILLADLATAGFVIRALMKPGITKPTC